MVITKLALLVLMAALLVLVLIPASDSEPVPRPSQSLQPLCLTQFARANHECAAIPYGPALHSSAVPLSTSAVHQPGFNKLYQGDHHSRSHRHRHHHHGSQSFHPLCLSQFARANQACAMIPHGPVLHSSAVPLSLSAVHHPDLNNLYHSHHHRHRHRHRHHNDGSHGKEECCRWLKEIDEMCVCGLLVHLPAFLARPIHGYKVVVDDECEVEYECPGRLRP